MGCSISILKSKIHNARVTNTIVHYEDMGSIAISKEIMKKAGLYDYERVLVVDNNNGERLWTYAIGIDKSDTVILMGAAARKVRIGDELIIMSFADIPEEEYKKYAKPKIISLGKNNKFKGYGKGKPADL